MELIANPLHAEASRDAHKERFDAFVRAHRAAARRLAWRLCGGDAAAAEDIAQEAFLRAYRGLDGFRDEAALSTWFTRIVIRVAHNHRRKRAVAERWRGLWGLERPAPAPPRGDPALRSRLSAALDELSRGQREAFVLVHLEGRTVRETAEILGKAPGTVKSHLHRALRSLRASLADVRAEVG